MQEHADAPSRYFPKGRAAAPAGMALVVLPFALLLGLPIALWQFGFGG